MIFWRGNLKHQVRELGHTNCFRLSSTIKAGRALRRQLAVLHPGVFLPRWAAKVHHSHSHFPSLEEKGEKI